MGRMGRAVARRARGFDMNVIYYDHRNGREKGLSVGTRFCENLEELFAASDFISLHLPLTEKTRHMIGHNAFAQMKKNAVLINTARGPIIDSDALYDALKSGRIASAALDVTDPEPLPKHHRLLTLSNCLVVPHIGSATAATRVRMAELAVTNLIAGSEGRIPPYLVNPEVIPLRR